jgi:hypothetical protein
MVRPTESGLASLESALRGTESVPEPFPHFSLRAVFDHETAQAILSCLEQDTPWDLESHSFYVHYGCATIVEHLSKNPSTLAASPEAITLIRKHLERIFHKSLTDKFNLVAHRMLPGHKIGVHNDHPAGGTETHRFLVNFNRGFEDSYGGHLVLFRKEDLGEDFGDDTVVLRPLHNAGMGMELSMQSYHYVDEIKAGERYSLVYSFWEENGALPEDHEKEETNDEETGLPEEEFRRLVTFLREAGADRISHSKRSLLDHLSGTYAILKRWGCDVDVCKAGLLHSVFGTASFSHTLIPKVHADVIGDLIGERALQIVRRFGRLNEFSLPLLDSGSEMLQAGEQVELEDIDVRPLVSLIWANTLEQMPYVTTSDEQMSQWRDFYRRSLDWLPDSSHKEIRKMLAIS